MALAISVPSMRVSNKSRTLQAQSHHSAISTMEVNDLDSESESIRINFLHPTAVEKELQATVSVTSTPRYLIEQLILSGFLARASAATQYRLVNSATGHQLFDHVTLVDAGIHGDSNLQVIHSATGA
jgi:hypothetical protein